MAANLFNKQELEHTINRLHNLSHQTIPGWGKMNAGQMLAHCSIPFEMAFGEKPATKMNFLMRFLVKTLIKSQVLGDKPFKKNSRTAPSFIIADERNYSIEKDRMIKYLEKTLQLGSVFFEGKDSGTFGIISAKDWNTMFSKHLDYHLTQFGV